MIKKFVSVNSDYSGVQFIIEPNIVCLRIVIFETLITFLLLMNRK